MQTPIAALLAALALASPAAAQAPQGFADTDTGRGVGAAGSAVRHTVLRSPMGPQGAMPPGGISPAQAKGQQAPQPQQGVSDDPSFRLTNRGSLTIQEVYVSSVRTDDWGEDRLGADVLEPGQSIIIRLPRGDCLNDIRIVFDDDSAQERRRVDTCALTDIGFP